MEWQGLFHIVLRAGWQRGDTHPQR